MYDDTQFDNIEREYTPFAHTFEPRHDSDQLSYGSNFHTPESEAFYLPCTQELNFGG